MNIISIFSIFSLFFSGFLGTINDDYIKNIDFNNQKIDIEGHYELSSPIDEDSFKIDFNVGGIHKKDKSKYNVVVDSSDESFNLKYFSDRDSFYFDTNSLKELAGKRANDNLNKIYSEYIKVDKNTFFGFKSKYPIHLIDKFLDTCSDKNSYENIASIFKKLNSLNLNTRMIKDKQKYTLYINLEDLVHDANLISKYILDNYSLFSKNIDILSKNLNISTEELKNYLINMQEENYFNELLKMFKGTNLVFNFNHDKLNSTNILSINADIILGQRSDYLNLLFKFKMKFKNTNENISLPTTYSDVTNDEYNSFYLPSISDLCNIILKDENNETYEIFFKKYPVLYENSLYIDETVIKQLSDDSELFRDHVTFIRGKKKLYIYPDYYVLGSQVYSKKINLLPLRPIAEFFGYKVDFQRDPSGFFNIEVKK